MGAETHGSKNNCNYIFIEGECPQSSSAVFCNDDFCGNQSELEFPVTRGMQYLLRIGGDADVDGREDNRPAVKLAGL